MPSLALLLLFLFANVALLQFSSASVNRQLCQLLSAPLRARLNDHVPQRVFTYLPPSSFVLKPDHNPPQKAVQKVQREATDRYDAAVADAAVRGQQSKEALSSLLPPRVVGICVGEGEAMHMLKGVDGVVCVGWKAGEELAKIVASCDIMVAPSEVNRAAVHLSE